MQMFKKSVALLLSVLMLLSMLTVAAGMTAFAAESYKVIAQSPQGVFTDTSNSYKAGDTFDITYRIKAKVPLLMGQFSILFDANSLVATKLTFNSKIDGQKQVGAVNNVENQKKEGGIYPSFSVDTPANYVTEDILMTVSFAVQNAISKDQIVKFVIDELWANTTLDDWDGDIPYFESSVRNSSYTGDVSASAVLSDPVEGPTEAPTTEAPTTTAAPEPTTTKAPEPTTTAAPSKRLIKFSNNKGWDNVNLYAWSSAGEMGAWPGTAMTKSGTNDLGEDVYTLEIDAKYDKIIFNNGKSGNENQTVDVDVDPTVTGYYLTDQATSGKWNVKTWTEEEPTTTAAPQPTTTEAPEPTTTKAPDKGAYYVAGSMNSWKPNDSYKLTANAATPGEYMLLGFKATSSDSMKVAYSADGVAFADSDWFPTGMGNDYKFEEDGTYNVYFRPEGNSDWENGFFYVEKVEEPTTEAPEPTTEAPEPTTTAAPEPTTTAAPEPTTTAAPEPTTTEAPEPTTTAAPEPTTTAAPEPTTAAPSYTFYYLPSAAQEEAGNTYKVNYQDMNGDWHNYTMTKTPITMDGVNLYSVSVPKDAAAVKELQYQVYNGDEWLSQNKFENVNLEAYDNKIVKADGSIDEKPTEPETTAAPTTVEPTTAEPTTAEPTTVEPTTAEPTTAEPTTAEPTTVEPTTAEPTTAEPTTAEPTTAEPTTVEPTTVEPTTAEPTTTPTPKPTVKPTSPKDTQAPTLAPNKVNFNQKPDVKSAVNAISKAKSDKDPKGSKFSKLKAKVAKTTKKSNKITWSKVKGAKKYIVMGNKCGKTNGKFNKFKKLKTTKGKSFTQKKLKKNTYYKYLVLAVNGKGKVICASKVMHVATKGGKNTNYKKIVLNKTKKTLKKGKTFKLKIKKMIKMNKKGKVQKHMKTRYESANTKIATVTSKGKIKAKKKGTTYVYAYAQNGVYARIKIKVK